MTRSAGAAATTTAVRAGAPAPRTSAVLFVACLSQFMVLLDVSIVNVALPSIGRDVGLRTGDLQWVVTAYAVAFAGLLLVAGRVSDLIGSRRSLLGGLAAFGVASLAAGSAGDGAVLIAGRVVQGVGAAALSAASLASVLGAFPAGPSRRVGLAVWNAAGGFGGAIGGALGGVLTSTLSWRWIFLINVPLAVVGALAARRTLPVVGRGRGVGFAPSSAVLASCTLFAVVLALSGRLSGAALVAAVAAVLVLGAGFWRTESRATSPLVDRGAVRTRSMSSSIVVTFLSGTTFLAIWFLLSLTLQQIQRHSPIVTGALFLPFGAGLIAASILSARVMARIRNRTLVLVATSVSTAGFVWLAAFWDAGYPTGLLPGGLLVVVGVGLLFAPLTALAASELSEGNEGTTSGLLNCSRQMGGSVGLALLSLVTFSGVTAPHFSWAYGVAAGLAALTTVAALRLPGR